MIVKLAEGRSIVKQEWHFEGDAPHWLGINRDTGGLYGTPTAKVDRRYEFTAVGKLTDNTGAVIDQRVKITLEVDE